MAQKILVTGSTGKVGSEVIKRLAAAGANVRAAVRTTGNTDLKDAEQVEMDFNKPESILAALEGVESAFLLTPVVPNQIELSTNFIEAAKQAGTKRIVKLSVIGAQSEHDFSFGRWHAQTEKDIERSGIPYTFLRANFFMQNFLGQPTIKTQGVFYDSSGDAKASHVDTRDIAAVAAVALTQSGHEGKAYDVTGPAGLSNYEIADILSSVTGRKITYAPVSDDDTRKALKAAGTPDWLAEAIVELYVLNRTGATAVVSPAVEQVTGRPPISFEQFAKDNIEAFK